MGLGKHATLTDVYSRRCAWPLDPRPLSANNRADVGRRCMRCVFLDEYMEEKEKDECIVGKTLSIFDKGRYRRPCEQDKEFETRRAVLELHVESPQRPEGSAGFLGQARNHICYVQDFLVILGLNPAFRRCTWPHGRSMHMYDDVGDWSGSGWGSGDRATASARR